MLYEASIMVCHPHRLGNNDKYHTGKHIWFHTQSGDDSKCSSLSHNGFISMSFSWIFDWLNFV
jgi:hypothetical protein